MSRNARRRKRYKEMLRISRHGAHPPEPWLPRTYIGGGTDAGLLPRVLQGLANLRRR